MQTQRLSGTFPELHVTCSASWVWFGLALDLVGPLHIPEYGEAGAGAAKPHKPDKNKHCGGIHMISWAVTFLIIGLIAAVLGFSGIAGAATNIAWILFVVGIVLAIVFAVMGRRPRI